MNVYLPAGVTQSMIDAAHGWDGEEYTVAVDLWVYGDHYRIAIDVVEDYSAHPGQRECYYEMMDADSGVSLASRYDAQTLLAAEMAVDDAVHEGRTWALVPRLDRSPQPHAHVHRGGRDGI